MPLPRISIVTPSYNHAAFIEWTVRSVLLQRYANLEYIVMDGGSQDRTREILAPYQRHFTYFSSEKDNGQADAVARGFARSTGDIMGYVNSDDLLAPDALHYVADYFQTHPEVDAVYSHRCMVDAANKVIGYWILPEHNSHFIQRHDLIPQETCFWRRSLYEKAGPVDPSYRFALDYDLFVRFMQHGTFQRVPRVLGAFRMHADSKTTCLLESLGKAEIQRVQDKYGITLNWRDHLSIALTTQMLHWRSRFHFTAKRRMTGSLPGVGYDYDGVWGGQLNEQRLPHLPVLTQTVSVAA